VARWCTGGTVAADFATCLSADELRATLVLRSVDVVILDVAAALHAPRLLREVRSHSVAVIGIDPPAGAVPGADEHFDGVLADGFTPRAFTDLLLRLDPMSQTMRRSEPDATASLHRVLDEGRRLRGRLVGVSSTGGAGASVVAMALAQGLAGGDDTVALVDGARRGQQCMYHDVGDVVPGFSDLVEAQGDGILDPDDVRALLFDQPERGYHLLLGRRHPQEFERHRAGAVGAALDAVARGYDLVVVDHDPDIDLGHAAARTVLGDRHAIAVHLLANAEVEVVVAHPGIKGVHDAARRVDELIEVGLPPERVVVCCNLSPRSPSGRAAFDRSVRALTRARFDGAPTLPVIHLRRSSRIEAALRQGRTLPAGPVATLSDALRRGLDALPRRDVDPSPVLGGVR
jgi:hypothetical protein